MTRRQRIRRLRLAGRTLKSHHGHRIENGLSGRIASIQETELRVILTLIAYSRDIWSQIAIVVNDRSPLADPRKLVQEWP
jgi:hypothetical protein